MRYVLYADMLMGGLVGWFGTAGALNKRVNTNCMCVRVCVWILYVGACTRHVCLCMRILSGASFVGSCTSARIVVCRASNSTYAAIFARKKTRSQPNHLLYLGKRSHTLTHRHTNTGECLFAQRINTPFPNSKRFEVGWS